MFNQDASHCCHSQTEKVHINAKVYISDSLIHGTYTLPQCIQSGLTNLETPFIV